MFGKLFTLNQLKSIVPRIQPRSRLYCKLGHFTPMHVSPEDGNQRNNGNGSWDGFEKHFGHLS